MIDDNTDEFEVTVKISNKEGEETYHSILTLFITLFNENKWTSNRLEELKMTLWDLRDLNMQFDCILGELNVDDNTVSKVGLISKEYDQIKEKIDFCLNANKESRKVCDINADEIEYNILNVLNIAAKKVKEQNDLNDKNKKNNSNNSKEKKGSDNKTNEKKTGKDSIKGNTKANTKQNEERDAHTRTSSRLDIGMKSNIISVNNAIIPLLPCNYDIPLAIDKFKFTLVESILSDKISIHVLCDDERDIIPKICKIISKFVELVQNWDAKYRPIVPMPYNSLESGLNRLKQLTTKQHQQQQSQHQQQQARSTEIGKNNESNNFKNKNNKGKINNKEKEKEKEKEKKSKGVEENVQETKQNESLIERQERQERENENDECYMWNYHLYRVNERQFEYLPRMSWTDVRNKLHNEISEQLKKEIVANDINGYSIDDNQWRIKICNYVREFGNQMFVENHPLVESSKNSNSNSNGNVNKNKNNNNHRKMMYINKNDNSDFILIKHSIISSFQFLMNKKYIIEKYVYSGLELFIRDCKIASNRIDKYDKYIDLRLVYRILCQLKKLIDRDEESKGSEYRGVYFHECNNQYSEKLKEKQGKTQKPKQEQEKYTESQQEYLRAKHEYSYVLNVLKEFNFDFDCIHGRDWRSVTDIDIINRGRGRGRGRDVETDKNGSSHVSGGDYSDKYDDNRYRYGGSLMIERMDEYIMDEMNSYMIDDYDWKEYVLPIILDYKQNFKYYIQMQLIENEMFELKTCGYRLKGLKDLKSTGISHSNIDNFSSSYSYSYSYDYKYDGNYIPLNVIRRVEPNVIEQEINCFEKDQVCVGSPFYLRHSKMKLDQKKIEQFNKLNRSKKNTRYRYTNMTGITTDNRFGSNNSVGGGRLEKWISKENNDKKIFCGMRPLPCDAIRQYKELPLTSITNNIEIPNFVDLKQNGNCRSRYGYQHGYGYGSGNRTGSLLNNRGGNSGNIGNSSGDNKTSTTGSTREIVDRNVRYKAKQYFEYDEKKQEWVEKYKIMKKVEKGKHKNNNVAQNGRDVKPNNVVKNNSNNNINDMLDQDNSMDGIKGVTRHFRKIYVANGNIPYLRGESVDQLYNTHVTTQISGNRLLV